MKERRKTPRVGRKLDIDLTAEEAAAVEQAAKALGVSTYAYLESIVRRGMKMLSNPKFG